MIRRRALVGGVAAVALGGAALTVGRRGLAPTLLRRRIRRALTYLIIPDPVLDRFVADHLRHRDEVADPTMPDHLRFLCSTDFFAHGADESRPLSYVGYHDPYLRPCAPIAT